MPKRENWKDLTGRVFGSLRVVRPYIDPRGRASWWCDCLACGRITIIVKTWHLENGKSTRCNQCKGKVYRKLTEDQVREIRDLHKRKQAGYETLARRYGVSKGVITSLMSGKTYEDVVLCHRVGT